MAEATSSKQEKATEIESNRAPMDLELEELVKIKEMYAAGIPLFTKDSMRELHQQLLKAKTGDKISMLDLDGTMSEFEITVGKVYDFRGSESGGADSESEIMHTQAIIFYQSIQALIWSIKDFEISFCPMPIYHQGEVRNKITKKLSGHYSIVRPDLPREEAEEFFGNCCKEWEASESCKQLRSMLETIDIPLGITKIVAFACSTFSCITQKPSLTRGVVRSATQHALILTLRDILSKKENGASRDITCYTQDPVYSSLDKEILGKSDIRILNDPVGFLEVDESTVVLSFSPNVCVRQVVCDIARPAMMIWDSIRWDEDEMALEKRCTDPDSPRLKKMIQDEYEEFKMPDDYDGNLYGSKFGNAGIYVRKTGRTSRL